MSIYDITDWPPGTHTVIRDPYDGQIQELEDQIAVLKEERLKWSKRMRQRHSAFWVACHDAFGWPKNGGEYRKRLTHLASGFDGELPEFIRHRPEGTLAEDNPKETTVITADQIIDGT